MNGRCLCGLTRFKLNTPRIRAYQCHCSLCRMQSGTASNLGAIVEAKDFEWLSGIHHIKSWVKDTGFTSDFCTNCGSPVPNKLRGMDFYWVPVGAMDASAPVEVVAHICINSKVNWVPVPFGSTRYSDLPNIADFIKKLNTF